jgi:hypothetical protein
MTVLEKGTGMNNNFAGWLRTFEKKNDDEHEDTGVLLEVTSVERDSTVELAFDDRNERVYVRFKLEDLMRHVCLTGIRKED